VKKVIISIALGAVLIGTVGVASAAAGTHHSKPAVEMNYSPAAPLAGQPFSISFSLVQDGTKLPIHGADCLGMTKHKPIPLQSVTSDGATATCTWNIPATAGPTFDGMLAFYDSNNVEHFGGYDLPISPIS
jgi:hypothetical protein